MKHLILTALFAVLALAAGAQENKHMTEKEQKEALQDLKAYYKVITGQASMFDDNFSEPRKVEVLPWQEWTKNSEYRKKEFPKIVKGFENMRLEAVEDQPEYCSFVLRCPTEGRGKSYMRGNTGSDRNFQTDAAGHLIGFRQSAGLSGLGVDIKFHLKDRNGKPVFIAPGKNVYIENGDRDGDFGKHEAYSLLMFPLTVPFSEVTGGYIDVRFDVPQQYEWVTLTKSDIGRDQTLGGVSFRLEQIKEKEFVLSALYDDSKHLNRLDYFYCFGDSIWEASSSSAYTGMLEDVMNAQQYRELTFEQWLAEKGVDPNNLGETLDNLYRNTDTSRRAKCFNSHMEGDTLLLYMPVDPAATKPLVTARIFAPDVEKEAQISIDQSQVAMLREQLLRDIYNQKQPNSSKTAASALQADNDGEVAPPAGPQLDKLIRSAKSKLAKETTAGVPPSPDEFAKLTRAEADALLADNDQISYAAGVIAAQTLWDEPEMRDAFMRYREEVYPLLYEWFAKGLDAHRQGYLNAEAVSGNEGMDVYRKEGIQELILKEIEREFGAGKKKAGIYNARGFEVGIQAFTNYRSMAARDDARATLATGKRMNTKVAEKGFRDYFERTLTQGLQYSLESLPQRRMVKALNCNENLEALTGFDRDSLPINNFKPVEGWNRETQQTEQMTISLRRELKIPIKAFSNGINGTVLLEVVVETDGAISQVIVKSSPNQLLSRIAVDAVYRVHMRPAMLGDLPAPSRISHPIDFSVRVYH